MDGDDTMSAIIEARNLVKIYGDPAKSGTSAPKPAVNDISFEVQTGEIFVIMGLSGSGKSTVLRMLNRLIDSTSGELRISGESLPDMDANRLREVRNKTINMVFQHFAIFPHRTVLYNAAYGLKVRGVGKREREQKARDALKTVGLEDWADRRPSDLSGGMRQRVGLARALATDSEILLMDEPFSALDPLIRRSMQDLLIHLHGELKKTVVFVTHDLNEAMRLGDRIMVMRNGEVVQLGTPDEILNAPADDYVAEFIGDVDRSRVITAGTAMQPARFLARPDHAAGHVLAELDARRLEGAFVVDHQGRLQGAVLRKDLVQASAQTSIGSLVESDVVTVQTHASLHDCLDLVGGREVPLGVVDESRRLLGVLSRQTLLSTLSGRKVESHARA